MPRKPLKRGLPDFAFRVKPANDPQGPWGYFLAMNGVAEMIEDGGADRGGWIVEKVTMTQEQFDNLPDFEGW